MAGLCGLCGSGTKAALKERRSLDTLVLPPPSPQLHQNYQNNQHNQNRALQLSSSSAINSGGQASTTHQALSRGLETDEAGVTFNFHYLLLALTVIVRQPGIFTTINTPQAMDSMDAVIHTIVNNKIFERQECNDPIEVGRMIVLFMKSVDIPNELMGLFEDFNGNSYRNCKLNNQT